MIGKTISHYRIVGKLGEGGMGVVYKAEDTRLDRTVALKFLGAHMIADQDSRRRFIREAKAAASLDHPNICTVYEIDEAEGKVFIAMACIEGRSLTDVIAGGPMKLPDALDVARQAARGLQEAHSKNIVHRDIKPANIMIGTTGSGERLVKIMDFGLAQLAGGTKLTRADTTLGTIAYMSPEQTQGTAVDQRSDVWSLGAVLYEMITGQQAFKGHYDQAVMYSILNEEPEPLTAVRSGVPMELEWILGKALAKTADRRYHSALEFAVDVENVLAKLQAGGSTVARSAVRVGPPPVHSGEAEGLAVGAGVPAEALSEQRRRRTRDALLDLGSQGLLPDRILSQALDLMAKPPEQRLPPENRRGELLDALQTRQIRIGEFIEQWQRLETPPAPSRTALASAPPAGAAMPPRSVQPMDAPRESAPPQPVPRGNTLEACCSLLVPGLGQLLQGRMGLGLLQLGLAVLLWIVVLGWIVHIWSMIDAARFIPAQPNQSGEFTAAQQSTAPAAMPPAAVIDAANDSGGAKPAARGWRTETEIFGWPLVHCVRGVDPATGKRLVARGVVAVGEIAVGAIACGGVAFGGLALGVVSGGVLALGACALGLMRSIGLVAAGPNPLGFATLPLLGETFFGGLLRAAAAVFLVRLIVRRRRFRRQFGDDGGAVAVWAIFGAREWRSDGTPFRGGNIVSTFGGCDVDLSGTSLAAPEVVIEATAVFGGIKIIVPPGWRIVTQGSQLFGAYANKTSPPQSTAQGAAPRLLVKGFALGGGVEVTHPDSGLAALSS